MNLIDGLEYYKNNLIDWQFTIEIENMASHVLGLLSEYRTHPTSEALNAAKILLIKIERWKAMCIQARIGNARKNSEQAVWNAFMGAVDAEKDIEAIRSVMRLTGFGVSIDEETGLRRAKVATSVLRFLIPSEWGVVDWRTAVMLAQLKNFDMDVDKALDNATNLDPNELRPLFDIIDEHGACNINQEYRRMRISPPLSRSADIDMALFGLSLMVWPIEKYYPDR